MTRQGKIRFQSLHNNLLNIHITWRITIFHITIDFLILRLGSNGGLVGLATTVFYYREDWLIRDGEIHFWQMLVLLCIFYYIIAHAYFLLYYRIKTYYCSFCLINLIDVYFISMKRSYFQTKHIPYRLPNKDILNGISFLLGRNHNLKLLYNILLYHNRQLIITYPTMNKQLISRYTLLDVWL